MQTSLLLEPFLTEAKQGVLLDVRTPAEYAKGHIPGAQNLPLFTDDERAVVGTLYVRTSREAAIEKGLEFVGPRMAKMVKRARKMAQGKPLYLYCWRGGMRSNSVAWLLRTAGMQATTLLGGYKAWRRGLDKLIADNTWHPVVVNGLTGCGKTEVLHELAAMGEQVLDLEGLANHRGSAFGALGQEKQPTTEHFANLIHQQLRTFDPSRTLWIEGESISIGRVFIPDTFWEVMCGAVSLSYSIPFEQRCERLAREYGNFDKEGLIASFTKIQKRLGGDNLKKAIELVEQGDMAAAAGIGLRYYDKGYAASIAKQSYPKQLAYEAAEDNPVEAAHRFIELIQQA